MSSRDDSDSMPYEPDPETAIRVGWAVTALGLLIFVVSALGEYLGWWDLVGEVGMLVGTVLSIVVGFGTWFSGAGRRQLSGVGREVRSVGDDVRSVDENVQSVGENVRGVHDAVLANGVKLEKLDKLDVIQAELDEQTGVLDRQLAVLSEMRDRM